MGAAGLRALPQIDSQWERDVRHQKQVMDSIKPMKKGFVKVQSSISNWTEARAKVRARACLNAPPLHPTEALATASLLRLSCKLCGDVCMLVVG